MIRRGWCREIDAGYHPMVPHVAVAIVFVALCVPETKGRTLEEIERRWLDKGDS